MARILSTAQKKTVIQAIPSSYTIDTIAFNASKKYANQAIINEDATFPIITLNYAQDGIQSEAVDIGGVFYFKAMLTMHILAKSASGLSGATICEGIAQSIMTTVKAWTTPLSGDIMVVDDWDIKPLDNRGIVGEFSGVFDYILQVDLWHS